MKSFLLFFVGLFCFVSTFSPLAALPVEAQTTPDPCNPNITNESHDQLQADLDACNAEITQWTNILNNTKKNTADYTNEVAQLTAKIKAAQANINAKNIAIAQLGSSITEKQSTINTLTDQIGQDQDSLAALIRKTNELDSFSLAEAMLSDQDLSAFFADANAYNSTQASLQVVTDQLQGTKSQTQSEKDDLSKQRDAAAEAKAQIEAAKAVVETNQEEEQKLVDKSKSEEATYNQVIADKQAKAAAIRAALFNLRDTGAIPFGTALTYAQAAQAATGVDPAFLLAIMTQESNLGANVGACYVTDPVTGNGVGANTGTSKPRVMSPTRDVPVFQDILSHIGGSMMNTRVSCWQPIYDSKGAPIGWGGAMGPAQFIPSTWQLFITRIEAANGGNYPDPWNARDAFMASAMYLSDLGASGGIYASERTAACKYYSGSTCKTSYAANYGNSVMAKAANIQTSMIDPLQGV